MSFLTELRTVSQIAFAPIRGETHKARLESFYSRQSEGYDAFREKLLKGRKELFEAAVEKESSGVWIDIGAGTGRNLEFVADNVPLFTQVHLVDLSPSLLSIAKRRIEKHGWKNVACLEADACRFTVEGPVRLITFSYSLTMIPDWFRALEHAITLLEPGGHLACIDFFVSRKHPESGRVRHGWLTRTFWPAWFASDGVNLTSEIPQYLQWKLTTERLDEELARVPYLVGKVPYFRFIGRK